jgi:uncharacterized membrane protein YgdD (TMEM256/DUF423 family)
MRWIATVLIAIAGFSCILAGAFAANDVLHPERSEPVASLLIFAVFATAAAFFAAKRALAVPASALWPLLLFVGICLACGWLYAAFHFPQNYKLLALFVVLLAGGLGSARLINQHLRSEQGQSTATP